MIKNLLLLANSVTMIQAGTKHSKCFFLNHTPWEVMVIITCFARLLLFMLGPQTVCWSCLPESFSRPP